MGILRTDRIAGLGGANAIKGSVFFGGDGSSSTGKGTSLNIADANDKADLNFAGNDFTFEAWVFPPNGVEWNAVYCQSWGLQIYINTGDSNGSYVRVYVSNQDGSGYAISGATSAYNSIIPDQWNHVAFSRSGNSWTIFTNGTAATSSTSSQSLVSSNADYTIGIFNSIGATSDAGSYFGAKAFISNLRIRTGAHYLPSTNFTPPVGELQKTSDTVLLACQSPGDITKEATGKTLVPTRKNLNDALPQASHFTPNSPVGFSTTTDVGTQFGSTFDGVTTFDSQAYMVVPGGNTRERNRGRGLILGGATGSPSTNTDIIKYFDVASQGITETFGNLTDPDGNGRRSLASLSSSTRACTGGGYSHGGSPGTVKNIIDFVTIATTGNATDFGDMQNTAYAYAPASNQTRGLFAGGYQPNNSSVVNTIDLITIATAGNGSNFGDLTVRRRALAGLESTTRGVFAGGTFPAVHDEIDFVTFSTTGDATDFGDLTDARDNVRASSSSTRGVIAGGRDPSNTNIIDFITIASAGNATDFGDLLSAKFYYAATGNKTRAVWAGDNSGTNAMEFVTIATTGNGVDFGDQNGTPQHYNGCASDSHGGLE